MSGTTQEIHFETNPSGAEVTMNLRVLGVTPVTVSLEKQEIDRKSVV